MVTQKELAERLNIPPATLGRALRELGIPFERIAGAGNKTFIEDKYIERLEGWFTKRPPLRHEPKEGVWYEQKTIADFFEMSTKTLRGIAERNGIKGVKPNHNITLYPDSAIFDLYHHLYIRHELNEKKLVPYKEKVTVTAEKKKHQSRTYWKVSIFNEKSVGYIVKAVCLKDYEAKEMVHELEKMGIMARASKHKNYNKEYYYGK